MPTAPNPSPGRAPAHDPTALTVALVQREADAVKAVIEARLDAMTKAVDLLQSNADKSPTIGELSASHEERFRSIGVQFLERDTRAQQAADGVKEAIAAALQAAKELGNEKNQISGKQIDQLMTLVQSATKVADEKISDLKDRLTLIEGRSSGGAALWGVIAGVATLLLAAAGVFGIAFKLAR